MQTDKATRAFTVTFYQPRSQGSLFSSLEVNILLKCTWHHARNYSARGKAIVSASTRTKDFFDHLRTFDRRAILCTNILCQLIFVRNEPAHQLQDSADKQSGKKIWKYESRHTSSQLLKFSMKTWTGNNKNTIPCAWSQIFLLKIKGLSHKMSTEIIV